MCGRGGVAGAWCGSVQETAVGLMGLTVVT